MTFARRLAVRLRYEGAQFGVVGSAAAGAADLDVVVLGLDDHLDRLVNAVAKIGGWSLLSNSMPVSDALRQAGTWHFGTPDGPLDVFVEGVDG